MATMRNNHSYVQRREALKRIAMRKNLPCHLCGDPIDYTAPYTDRRAFTADHIEPIATGGSMTGPLKPAHRSCNSRRGDKPLTEYMNTRVTKPQTGGVWW